MGKITTTKSQPHQTVLEYFAIFKNVAHCLESGETPSYSASHHAPNYVQRISISQKHGKITTKIQFTGTATQPQRHRIFRQFDKDQYCM